MPRMTKYKDYNNMKNGDFFICGNGLYIKCDTGNQEAVCIQNGDFEDGLCDFQTIPVDVEIKWAREKSKTEGKKGKK